MTRFQKKIAYSILLALSAALSQVVVTKAATKLWRAALTLPLKSTTCTYAQILENASFQHAPQNAF